MNSKNQRVIANLEVTARSTEEIIESLKEEIKQFTLSRMVTNLRAENELLLQDVASLKNQLETLENSNRITRQQEPAERTEQETLNVYDYNGTISASKAATPAVSKEEGTPVKSHRQKEERKKISGKFNSDHAKPKKDRIKHSDTVEEQAIDIGRLDLRIGKIVSVQKHPEADSLYVEQIDIGEKQPRTVVSGLVKHVSLEEMQSRLVIVLCNLKPAKMRGVTSEGMVMCAVSPEKVEVLVPPQACVPGDEVVVDMYPRNPDVVLNPKKKVFETVAVDLKTNDDRIATYKSLPLSVPGKGLVTSPSLTNVFIK